MIEAVDESKFYVVPLHETAYKLDSLKLAVQILDSGFMPDIVLPIWRGGSVPFTYVTGVFERVYEDFEHFPVQGYSYRGPGVRAAVGIRTLPEAIEIINGRIKNKNGEFRKYRKILVGDDVFDEGLTAKAFLDRLREGVEHEKEIKIATVYWKPYANKTNIRPDFHARTFDRQTLDGVDKGCWIIFPHEVKNLNDEQLQRYYPEVYDIIVLNRIRST